MESTRDEVYFILNLSLKIDDSSLKIIALFSFELNQPRHLIFEKILHLKI